MVSEPARRHVSDDPLTVLNPRCDGERQNSSAVLYVYFVILAVMMGAQVFMASRLPQAQLDNAPAPAASTVAPQMAPPSSGQ